VTLKSKDLATHAHGFQKKLQTQPLKLAEADPSFRKVKLLPAKLGMLFLLSKILASTKMGGAIVLKGRLSRAPWSGKYWMLLNFQAALQALQQSHTQEKLPSKTGHTGLPSERTNGDNDGLSRPWT